MCEEAEQYKNSSLHKIKSQYEKLWNCNHICVNGTKVPCYLASQTFKAKTKHLKTSQLSYKPLFIDVNVPAQFRQE